MAGSGGGSGGGGFKLASAFVELRTEESQLDRGLANARRKVEAATSKTATGAASMFKTALAFAGVRLGIEAVAGAIKESVGAAMDAQKVNLKLAEALRMAGGEARVSVGDLSEYADTLKDLYGIDDDVSKAVMTFGLNLGVTRDQIQGATQVAIGLAEATKQDLSMAMETLTKAMQGNFMMLERQFPQLAQYHTAQEKLAFVERLAAKGLREKQAAMEGASGAMTRMKLAASDLGKELGGFVLPALSRVTQDAADFFKTVTAGTGESERAMLSLHQAWLKTQKFWADFKSDAGGAAKLQEQIDAIEQQVQASITKQVNAANEGANKALRSQLKMLGKLKGEHKDTVEKIEDIWKDAQQAISEGDVVIGQQADARANAAEKKPDWMKPLEFKKDADTSTNPVKATDQNPSPSRGGKGANTLRDQAGTLHYDAIDAQKQIGDPEKIADRDAQRDAAKFNEKMERQRVAAAQAFKNIPQNTPSVDTGNDLLTKLLEMMTATGGLKVKSSYEERLVNVLNALTAAMRSGIPGTFVK